MAYDVSDHPLLETKGQQLYAKNSESFEHQVAIAVGRLKLASDTSYTAAELPAILRAITMQVNYQLDLPRTARFIKQESSAQTKMNITYRDGIPLVSEEALEELPERVRFDAWDNITSVRRAVQ